MKDSIQQEDIIIIINIYTPIDRPSKYRKQKLTKLKGQTDTPTIIVGDFNTPLTVMDGTTRQKSTENLTQ